MKNIYKHILMLFVIISITACSFAGPLIVTDNPGGKGSKVGEASYTAYLGFIRPINADISIQKAAKKGKITKISTVDYKISQFLFISTTYKVIVTGE